MSRRDSHLATATLALLISAPWLPASCHRYPASSSAIADDAISGASGAAEIGSPEDAEGGGGGAAADSRTGSPAHAAGAGGDRAVGSGGDGGSGGGDGGSGGSDDAREPLAPSHFPGLALWLDVSDEQCSVDIEGRITECADASSHSNHARQALPERRPTLAHDAVNGHAAMHFDTPNWQAHTLVIEDAASLRLAQEDFVVALVAAWTNDTSVIQGGYGGYGIMVTKQAMVAPYAGLALLANYPGLASDHPTAARFAVQLDLDGSHALSASTNLNDGAFRLLVARRAGLQLEVRVDGVSQTRMQTASVVDISNSGYPVVIGGVDGSALSGHIAEVVLVGGDVPETKVEQLEAYLLRKYAL